MSIHSWFSRTEAVWMLLFLCQFPIVSSFVLTSKKGLVSTFTSRRSQTKEDHFKEEKKEEDCVTSSSDILRRQFLHRTLSVAAGAAWGTGSTASSTSSSSTVANAFSFNPFVPEDQISTNHGLPQPAKRATAYLVDSTIPPTLVPFQASREAAILKQIGSGSGTRKTAFIEEEVNLNNFMNKGVFGTIELLQDLTGNDKVSLSKNAAGELNKSKKTVNFDASFVFLGMDYKDTSGQDATLAISLMTDILKPRRGLDSAIALDYIPQSLQSALDEYISSKDANSATDTVLERLTSTLINNHVSAETIAQQLPILEFAKAKNLKLIACSPEFVDITTVRQEGIQNVNPERRSNYVVDSQGFIDWTQAPKNRMYTDKSLLKDFESQDPRDGPANFFGERILVHETMATTIAKYAVKHPKTLVIGISQIKDVRFMGGPNGRVVRVCKALNPDMVVEEDAVTTILINPSAEETLSQSKFLRLEIGTAPSLLQYQTKVSDYLWFSTMPKVNMLPRLMNGY